MSRVFEDSEEYTTRKNTPFVPPKVSFSTIHASLPKHLYQKSTAKGLYYTLKDVACAVTAFKIGTLIDPCVSHHCQTMGLHGMVAHLLMLGVWTMYWWCQGIILAGCWCLGHEAGHGNLSPYSWVNHVIGFTLHTFLLVPYYAWRSTHHAHHKATNSIERDENYVPRTRRAYGLPPASKARPADYHEVFEDAPLYTLGRIFIMQAFGWHYYLLNNAMGSPSYPRGTNHFSPSSPLFHPEERQNVIRSNVALSCMAVILGVYAHNFGFSTLLKLYGVPYLLMNHWIVMMTFLHHSDPTLPYYRRSEWTFLRGALATVDRPFLGWIGRFFFHNVSHDHIAHHLFSYIPFYNQPEVTAHLKRILKEDYNYDSTNVFRALYRSFTECCFIEDEGDIVFYKNRDGKAARVLQDSQEPEKRSDDQPGINTADDRGSLASPI